MTLRYTPTTTTVVRVTGADAATFLQGQCAADLRRMEVSQALWLNRKGRVLAHTLVVKEADGSFLLLSPHTAPDELIAVVTANVIADDVEAIDVSAQWQRGVLWGQGVPAEIPGVRCFKSARAGAPSWEVLAPLGWTSPWAIASSEALEADRILAGVPSVPADCGANEFPQECGLEPWVSYTKGCYLGQEVMARIQSMGSLRRILRRVASAEGTPLSSGTELSVAGKVVGKVRSVAGPHGLALVALDLPAGTVCGAASGGVVLGEPAAVPAA
jgi:folate-binding protein YgfZ